jgi:signal peptidase I
MTTTTPSQGEFEPRGYGVIRDYVESIAMAIMLAFIFRMFLLEAFVIPTGSMAPTLHGRHMDVICLECGFQYQTGASSENPDSRQRREVVETDCPLCRYPMELDKEYEPNERSFMGDRILVSKFSYSVGDPKRWQVIVFKFPGNAKQNYIKRLVGLPGERIKISGGDIYAVPPDAADRETFQIVRKPPRKLLAMLQLVHDSEYVPTSLDSAGWPARWQPWSSDGNQGNGNWTKTTKPGEYMVKGNGNQVSYLRYRHHQPTRSDWADVEAAVERMKDGGLQGKLITDYYAYNHGSTRAYNDESTREEHFGGESFAQERSTGRHWVGDLAAEFEIEVINKQGQVLLDLVEGGTHFQCSIDVQTGQATLSRVGPTGKKGVFTDQQGAQVEHPTGETKMTGPGSYELRFSNVDNELLLWVNNRLVSFQGPTTYQAEPALSPHWRPDDPGDLAPVGIGNRSVGLVVNRMRVLRDVYYVALTEATFRTGTDYGADDATSMNIREKLADYHNWEHTSFFRQRTEQVIPGPGLALGPEDYLPLGDNSPESSDGRMWPLDDPEQQHTVHRRLLIGQAMFVYWPHSWRWGRVPIVPNISQMRMIK